MKIYHNWMLTEKENGHDDTLHTILYSCSFHVLNFISFYSTSMLLSSASFSLLIDRAIFGLLLTLTLT